MALTATVGKALTKVFGSRNERLLKRYHKIVDQINALEPEIQKKTDAELKARTLELRQGLTSGKLRSSDVLPEGFAIIREAMDRNIGIRTIFNPVQDELAPRFDPDRLDDHLLEVYDSVQRHMIATGESWLDVPIPVELYAGVRALYPESRPPFRARCFDVQLIGGLVLYEGRIAEMATGEGKTFVGPLACFMRNLEGMHAHVLTVNDYLVRRDATWVLPAFRALGLTVGFVQSDMEPGGEARRQQYQCDVTYGTNSEFGFDYLRDNMKERRELQVQGPLEFAIVDEVDSILIDEARTPLIISGPAHEDAPKYAAADAVARKIMELNRPWDSVEKAIDTAKRAMKAAQGDEEKARTREERDAARKRYEEAEKQLAESEKRKEGLVQYYEVELDRKSVHLTHEGVAAAQEAAGVGSFYVGENMDWPHLMEQSMRAHVVYERDKDYVVERGSKGEMEVVIVDEYTGRKMAGRQWSDGLHQAVEAKERVTIKQETQTLATITLQNFFKLYKSLSGMTGTAQTESEEFMKIYNLEVVTIPTNRPVIRQDNEDRVYRKEAEKWSAIIDEIKLYSEAGRPVLVGTTSVEKSEMLSAMLKRKYGIEHEVLNAKQHEREAHIVALAGQTHKNAHGEVIGNVTIATNMAGRGTDIKPAAETFFDVNEKLSDGTYRVTQRKTAKTLELKPLEGENNLASALQLSPTAKIVGGLHVIGTERHTSRRIDNQLRGRSGRQGDPGSSRFYISLEDELMKMFAGEWTIKVLGWLGMEEGMAIEDKRITKGIIKAQKKVEERNFLSRKNLLDYDEVMDQQRTTFYGMRQRVLEGRDVEGLIWEMIDQSIDDAVQKYISSDYVAANIAEWARINFDVSLDPQDLAGRRDLDDLENYIKDQSRAEAETSVTATLGEFMGEDDSNADQWDTRSLSSWAMSRFQVSLPQNQIRKMTADELETKLRSAAIEQINRRDTSGLVKFVEPLFAEKALAEWADGRFSVKITPAEMFADAELHNRKPAEEISQIIQQRARELYARREIEVPVDNALFRAFGPGDAEILDNPFAADFLRSWTRAKYGVELTVDYIRSQPRRRLRDELIGLQESFLLDGKLEAQIKEMIRANPTPDTLLNAYTLRFGALIPPAELQTTVKQAVAAEQAPAQNDGGTDETRPAQTKLSVLLQRARAVLRLELTMLEQFFLIQKLDQSWKDHLYAMDMLKGGVGLASFAEMDPRVVYKKEGFIYFQQMMAGVRDKVTDLIFRANPISSTQSRSQYRETAAVHEQPGGYGAAEDKAQNEQATAQSGEAAKPRTIVREVPKVGRNDPCPCGSGKKYKKCCGINS